MGPNAILITSFLAALLALSGVAIWFLIRLRTQLGKTEHTDVVLHRLAALEGQLSLMREDAAAREGAVRQEAATSRIEMSKRLDGVADTLRAVGKDQSEAQGKLRDVLDARLKELQAGNEKKLDQMRRTVDEQLQTTLERRLTESFKSVAERLEAVNKGLGEMQSLASDVGGLKRVLTSGRARGGFGETQLRLLIDDFLTPDQFAVNFDCGRADGKRVEFAVRMPGADSPVYLPVDAKFPQDDYERLLEAAEAGDQAAIDAFGKKLDRRMRDFAKDVSGKYINPPVTTDMAVIFLPSEGLYAEILRRPGLFEALQRDHRVMITGPINFQAFLTTIRYGHQQTEMQEQAAEVLKILGGVHREFDLFGSQIEAMTKNLNAALNHVGKLETRKNVMKRVLKSVSMASDTQALGYFGDRDGAAAGDDAPE